MRSNPYQSLVSLLSNILEAYTTAFFIVDSKNRRLNLLAIQSLSRSLSENISMPLDQSGILSQAHKVGQTIHLDKLPEVSSNLTSAVPFYGEGESHIKALYVAPVGDGEGVLYVDTKYGWGFNDKQQKWIREIADVLYELLQRQESSEHRENYARIFDLWQHLDEVAFKGHPLEDFCRLIVSECSKLVGAEYGFLALREHDRDHYRIYASTPNVPPGMVNQHYLIKHGLVGRIFQNGKQLFISRLNPQTQEHFLFSPSESLPHHGAFWGLPAETTLGHSVVLTFLSRQTMEKSGDMGDAVSHALHFFQLLLEQLYYKEECDHLQTYDLNSGLLNAFAFEARVDRVLGASMQNSVPFTLALLQFESWQMLSTKASPRRLRLWQREIASGICDTLPEGVFIGQMTENRFGMLFPETTVQEVKHHLTYLAEFGKQLLKGKIKGARLQAYLATVGFPQDGTRSEELWPLVNQRLFTMFRSRTESSAAQNI